jgi:hypothetical protein
MMQIRSLSPRQLAAFNLKQLRAFSQEQLSGSSSTKKIWEWLHERSAANNVPTASVYPAAAQHSYANNARTVSVPLGILHETVSPDINLSEK